MPDLSFIAITLAAILFFYFGTGRNTGVLVVSLSWMVLVGVVSGAGFFEDERSGLPKVMLGVNLPVILYVVYLYRQLNPDKIQQNWLLAVHALRVLVEITLYRLFLDGKIPRIMTFEGWNFDILIGLTAILLLAYRLYSGKGINRLFFRAWNIAGIVFLAIIVITAILSAPSPIQQLAFDQPNIAVTRFPYIFLPAIVVPLVLLSHLLVLKSIGKQGSRRK
ncbi:hypothetical protein [Chitinophaga barathri]|uniref:Uncharacterized protein n=1 Tax=Chitinophaga barathri TaxID=1647451 RepID=A0A3N4MBN5_9BACT|nr:hypothetical protein [Chitinophaga barathri]RPD40898.1 hypothetical protein EG028_12845 [Chitinophaga barathri]